MTDAVLLGRVGRWLALAGFAAGLVAAPAGERFVREVDEGTTLRRTFALESALELESLELVLDGEPHPAGGVEGGELRESLRAVVEDDFGPPAAGRPRRLVRYFEELRGESARTAAGPDGVTQKERAARSDLEGRGVSFALGLDEQGEYAVAWEQHPGEDELLEGLVEDMDLRAFLPPERPYGGEPIDADEAWEVPASAYLSLARPGGVELVAGDRSAADRRLARELGPNLSGTIRAAYRGAREVDGATLAVVSLALALTGEASAPIPTEDESTVHLTLRTALELEGELLWDSAGGHLHSLELGGRAEREELTAIVFGAHESEQRARYAGTLAWTVQVERAE